ncbi:Transposon Ty3-I Gag-Pol polyprotein [Vitis vinifera]|uniref:Transposon Ty3-I Gag-Pol polyprotein n=1 Tax=Vitis vinifera TaxID=29760 RepID=A0A438EUM1_VITVI|nr:Transposon Ty3-I Gag-Pol polyprotein [Vitis vinifera]
MLPLGLTIQTEIDKLSAASFNPRGRPFKLVGHYCGSPKEMRTWRVCVDYIDLNDVYPKDSFSLPRIEQIVDSTSGHKMFSFLDVFSGYHQIPMFQPAKEKTTFITP